MQGTSTGTGLKYLTASINNISLDDAKITSNQGAKNETKAKHGGSRSNNVTRTTQQIPMFKNQGARNGGANVNVNNVYEDKKSSFDFFTNQHQKIVKMAGNNNNSNGGGSASTTNIQQMRGSTSNLFDT